MTGTGISLVVLAKDPRAAKTRVRLLREDASTLALHLAATTVRAGLAAESVAAVWVVTSGPGVAQDALAAGAGVVAEHHPLGMNRAASLGRRRALAEHRDAPVAVMVADLPHLQPGDLDVVVRDFLAAGRALFVPDIGGTGTTFVVHGPERWPGVQFGPGSADAHRRLGYRSAEPAPLGLRIDLDTDADLAASGLGRTLVTTRPDLPETFRAAT